jgi:uncharacterized protein
MSLIINVQTLPEEGVSIHEEYERSWLTNIPDFGHDNEQAYIKGLIRLSGSVVKEGSNLRLRGRVACGIHTFCSRCGKEMEYPVNSEFELVLMPGKAEIRELEKELTPEDLDHLYYQGTEIDLAPYFQEQVALEVPMQFLCRPDCKGICPGCGANLNLEPCRCRKEESDPRLSVLRQLKIGK